ncbi:cupredoxin domain-containing protein [Ureibacillus acetophenoni]|uniref:EfeO-type cupredoxin-like domain-containing protein n=1 Tax=Ureibacillus acetophenoni TaxID=614649 RepID=A0A285UM26_9BACL|nr:cupredoxin domain-containing protein [Ureibacillus acetophenoni]SOC42974.1 hypothetical protein SAMN05877842_11421 [Ureibacillus acetophenoni]
MGYYQLFILVSLLILTVIVILLSRILKKNIKPMHGMSIIMFYSMNFGLTIGTLFGGLFQGNLFLSTVVSILSGSIIGLICGSVFGILAALEGIMSGLMGGMMGAMLGEMVSLEQIIPLVRIFLLLSILTIFLFAIFSKRNNLKDTSNKFWVMKPLVIAALITFYFIGGVSYAEKQVNIISEKSHDHNSDKQSSKQQGSKLITIETKNMMYFPSNFDLQLNESVTIILKNQDNIEHDFEVKIPTSNKDQKTSHTHGENENVIHLHAGPKKEQTISFTPTESGLYEFVCTIPGHKESGMIGWISVV